MLELRKEGACPFPPLLPPASCSSLKSQMAPTLKSFSSGGFQGWLRESEGRVDPHGWGGRLLPASADTGWLFSFFFSHTPRKMPTSPKESGVSCVPHGTRGKEMIKAVRFPGSSWCLRWVLIWEESEERLGPVAICQRPQSVWVADDMGAGGHARSVYTF